MQALFDAHKHKTITTLRADGPPRISGIEVTFDDGSITDGPDGDLFRADITEVVLTHLNDAATLLVIEWWTAAQGLRTVERE
ncbi:hypothetical protein ORI20_26360 [Mycobacterium sp. CVI_P3]|uniref:Uncharacterized protein n=1 Tax=Mycobacterium pinniadriaticum TaxID=2994102 RepID=A0ABT3SN50_9MYCO|nr:hypothetical protein [Mycobacterium pinniadriaticum]MCX2933800.1 hypothetical protein [Mycobacterium pinniadriaticum]MCX2940222.1 hypothetical protein [Mycobacterium pinniadriaticum]